MQPSRHIQRSLFEEAGKTPDIPASRRSTLVHLIEALLVEAVTKGTNIEAGTATKATREAAHEQDHA